MIRKKHKKYVRLAGWILALSLMMMGGYLVLNAFNKNVVFYITPSDLLKDPSRAKGRLRLGGLVKKGSVVKKGTEVMFAIHDGTHEIQVTYDGLLPDLFREEKGIVTEGFLKGSTLMAETVLAKHDENYYPPNVQSLAAGD